MLKRKGKNNKTRKSQLIIVGSLLIIIGISAISYRVISNIIADKQEQESLAEFYDVQEEIIQEQPVDEVQEETVTEKKEEVKQVQTKVNYLAVLQIPRIGLEKGLYSKDSYYNNVDRNIEILDESDMPDKDKGNVILAGHSGNGRVSYFRNLNKLKVNDMASIFYNGYEYRYKVVNIYDVEKNGTAHIIRNAEKSTLTLITCRHNTNKQIIIICELVEKV